jgi:hypothetical protein
MTLVAAFRVIGAPALLGDLLITSPGGHESTRKKIVKLADNLVVGWTGHLVAAQLVISTLQHSLGGSLATFTWLRDTLTSFNQNEFGILDVILVGWLVDNESETCFRWRSDYASEVFTGDPMIDGSGAESIFRDIGLGLNSAKLIPPDYEERRKVLGRLMGELMREEIRGPTNRPYGFGHGFEVLLFENGRFEYVDILYYALQYTMLADGKYESFSLIEPIVKFTHREGYTIVWTLDATPNTEKRELITPPGITNDVVERRLLSVISQSKFDFRSDLYCQLICIKIPGFENLRIIYMHTLDAARPGMFSSELGVFSITVSEKLIESVYQSIRQDLSRTIDDVVSQ